MSSDFPFWKAWIRPEKGQAYEEGTKRGQETWHRNDLLPIKGSFLCTLESGIDVAPCIKVASEKIDKEIKCSQICKLV